ncbi:MAG TPA: DNA polymerase III subunit delta [Spirochaetota bacterium]|nr:DNA polymerase III subunit delta [Spirochaetota bacterium]HPI88653.1 DNA polymerase III subunit delta [Spirochaetota bacterium]HPR49094.1 DNA polymerase III subunit delta [Spirochaetota bacterium]
MQGRNQTSSAFREELNRGKLDHIYLFTGEEEGEKEKTVSIILDLLFKEIPERANCIARFHIENNEFDEAADFLLSQSIFYPVRACILYNIDSLKKEDRNTHLLEEIFLSMPDSMTLIMTTEHNAPPAVLAREMIEKIKIVQFWRYFDRDIERYIAVTTAKMGITLDKNVVSRLLDLTGKDIRKIDEALEMLRSSSESRIITEEILLNLVHDRRESTIFEFIDALFLKNKKAFVFLNKIISEGVPELLILNMIFKQGEAIEQFHSLTSSGLASEEAINKCGVHQRKKDIFWKMVRAYDAMGINKIFPLIARADYELKSGGRSRDIINNPVFKLTAEILYS